MDKPEKKKTGPVIDGEPPVNLTVDVNLENPPMRVEGLRLNLGSGCDRKPGFINIDLYDTGADIKADIRNLPFHDNSVAQIICYQVMEHFPQNDLLPLAKEIYRVLKSNANAIIVVPDIVSACERVIQDPSDEWAVARIYGNQSSPGQFHMSGFTPQRAFVLFGRAGFRMINMAYFSESNLVRNIYIEAIK